MAEPLSVADSLFGVPATSLPRVARLVDGNWPAALAARADDALFFRAAPRAMQPTALFGNQPEYLTLDIPSPGAMTAAAVARMYRNGHQPVTVKTTSGPVTLERPKLRGTDTAFASRLLGKHVTKAHALEALVIAGYVRGLSTRDVEASLAEALGTEAALSRSTVSRVCEAIKDQFDAWRSRSVAKVELEYLYLDASHFRMHQGARAEPVLCAWGITTDGKPVLLAPDGANAESTDACVGVLRDLVARGLRPPLLVITDGAPGPLGAVEQVFPHSLRQRWLVHRARNVLAKVSQADQDAVKADYWQVFDDIHADPGAPAVAEARRRAEAFAAQWGARYPSAVACVLDTLPELTCHLRFPREHWSRIGHSNLIERTFGETRRRTKVIGRLPGERSCLSLVWAVLDRASRGWRGVDQRPANVRLLQRLRHQLIGPPTPERPGR